MLAFLQVLCRNDADGRVMLATHDTAKEKTFLLRFLLLNAMQPFADVVQQVELLLFEI